MIYITEQSHILVACKPVDFRKQIDGLVSLCSQALGQQPRSGKLFVFINKPRTMIRILCYDNNGYWLATKRLSQGRYTDWPVSQDKVHPLQAHELTRIIKSYLSSDSIRKERIGSMP